MLILSILSLFAGPLLYQWMRRGGRVAKTVEQAIVAALVLLVVFLLVPESLGDLGVWALVLMVAGYAVPGLLELAVKRAAHTFHVISLLLALTGLVIHALLDGAGLAGSAEAGPSLALAIVLHRFGVGLLLWFMVQPVFGRRAAMAVLALMAVATVAGYALSQQVFGLGHLEALHAVQALVIGTIIHSLVHRGHAHRHVHEVDSEPPA